ncbi:MAG: metalloregulator ArsR/SmtB family transcription factor [Sedimentisphaerales bacterium]|nr:metalloregulator ArsR/SmtB family transcription factor [Sedimentisphaerales bacterium]
MDKKDINKMMAVFKALSSPKRVRILWRLMQRPIWGGALCKEVRQTRTGLHRNLDILKKAGLVRGERQGQRVYYGLAPDAIKNCQEALSCLFSQQTTPKAAGRQGRRGRRR